MRAINRILVVKLADIGDAILSLPAIQAIRSGYPDAQIDVLTTHAGALVFERSPVIDNIIRFSKARFDSIRGLFSPGSAIELARLTWRLRTSRYDAVVLLHHLTTTAGARKFRELTRATSASVIVGLDNGRGTFLTHRAADYGFGAFTENEYGLQMVRALGVTAEYEQPVISIPDDARESANGLRLESSVTGDYIVIHPEVGEFSRARSWPVEKFVKVASHLADDHGIPAVFVGTTPESTISRAANSHPQIVDLTGRTTFPQLCALVEQARLVIGCDSSVSHLAGAFARPVVTLFGPSNVDAWRPIGSNSINLRTETENHIGHARAIHVGMPCAPCLYTGYDLGRPDGCPSRRCMHAITVDDVVQEASEAFTQSRI